MLTPAHYGGQAAADATRRLAGAEVDAPSDPVESVVGILGEDREVEA